MALLARGNGDGTFGEASTIPTASAPNAVVAAHLNGDARTDLVTADTGSGTVSIFFARQAGGFEPRRSVEVGEAPVRIVPADADGDGDTDLVVLRVYGQASEMALLRNHGDGSFEPKESIASGINPATLVVTDLNGDRKPDLVVPRTNQTEILVYAGKVRQGPDMDIKELLVKALHEKENKRGRSTQVQIGPSELGGCRRKVWYRLNNQPETNDNEIKLAAIMGTAIHAAIENALANNQDVLLEKTVEYGGMKAHVDCFIPGTGDVVDWKRLQKSRSFLTFRQNSNAGKYKSMAT